MNKTPIYIEDFPTSAYEDRTWMTEYGIIDIAFRSWTYHCYSSDQILLYSTFDSTGMPTNDLWIKDVSSTDGEAIHIADNVADDCTCYDSGEKAIYYVVYPGMSDGYYGEEYAKYRYDIQTGESIPWEKGGEPQEAAYISLSTEKLYAVYGVGSGGIKEMQDGEGLLAVPFRGKTLLQDRQRQFPGPCLLLGR